MYPDYVDESLFITIDPEIKQMWVDDLRSGKYQQIQSTLEYKGSFCCLGVISNLASDLGVCVRKADENSTVRYDDQRTSLPSSVVKWLAGENAPGDAYRRGVLPFSGLDGRRIYLEVLNDKGMTFDQIADLIEFWY